MLLTGSGSAMLFFRYEDLGMYKDGLFNRNLIIFRDSLLHFALRYLVVSVVSLPVALKVINNDTN